MSLAAPCAPLTAGPSREARQRMAGTLFRGDWLSAVFLHYQVDSAALQPLVPYPLDLRDGAAFVSLVAFTLGGLRSHRFPRAGGWLLRAVSDHAFLNVRTYVRHGAESGIYFLAEWLSNRLSVPLGRPLYGLPYHFARFDSRHDPAQGRIRATITAARGSLRYRADPDPALHPAPCLADSLDEFLLERYTAFTQWGRLRRYFRIWHQPWPVIPLAASVGDAGLLDPTGPWFRHARLVAAHYSPGVRDVWMGGPQFLWQEL